MGIWLAFVTVVALVHFAIGQEVKSPEAKRFDVDFVKRSDSELKVKEDTPAEEMELDRARRFDPYTKRFDPYSKRFDPYSKRFEPFVKRFDPYMKRFEPYGDDFYVLGKRFDVYKRFDPYH